MGHVGEGGKGVKGSWEVGAGGGGDPFVGVTLEVGNLEKSLEVWAGLLCMSVRHWQAHPPQAVLRCVYVCVCVCVCVRACVLVYWVRHHGV